MGAKLLFLFGAVLCTSLTMLSTANAGQIFLFSDSSGLSAEAEFTAMGSSLEIRLKNTSTGAPVGFSNSDQILTGVSWDFGAVGFNGDPTITGGSVKTGPTSASLNFDITSVGANADVSGEYGYGNMNGTGALTNFVTANTAVATPFGGANLDGPVSIDGPQGGLVASPEVIALGGLGAIQDEVIITLSLSEPVAQADLFGDLGEVRVEFGSDAQFITVPEPSSLLLLSSSGLFLRRIRHRR